MPRGQIPKWPAHESGERAKNPQRYPKKKFRQPVEKREDARGGLEVMPDERMAAWKKFVAEEEGLIKTSKIEK